MEAYTAGIRAVPESCKIRNSTPIFVKLDIKSGQLYMEECGMPTLSPINFLIHRPVPEAVSPAETPQIHIKFNGFL
jgi:hypothetical protein